MRSDSGKELTVLKVDGGLTNSDLCMQIQSDTIGINVERPHMREMTALGAAIAAGIGCGFWKSEKDVVNQMRESKKIDIFTPVTTPDVRENHLDAWKKAIKKSFP
ncbi:hypothetical protein HK096_002256 [Nowakowskiella sp. JEL0078]|nr:hypothetical protein HK096_002256 [Nowakowskiella sp. JEL0078]